MRILNNYVATSFLLVFIVTLTVFMFVMALSNLFRVVDLFARGVSGMMILKVFTYGMPFSLIFAIPVSALATSYLVYSRMASDMEVVAIKACGVSLWQVVRVPLVISMFLTVLCVYINCDLAPKSHFARRQVIGKLGMQAPLSLLDEGRFIHEFPGYTIYIGQREGSFLTDIVIYEFGEKGIQRTIRADSGTVTVDEEQNSVIVVNLFDVRIDQADENDPGDLSKVRHITAGEYPIYIDVDKLMHKDIVWKKRADLTMAEILVALSKGVTSVMPNIVPEEIEMMRTALKIEANTRLALSASCFSFVLLGAALGVKIHRKESTIGIALTLILVFVFYFFIIIADSLESRPGLHPEMIVWIPFLVSVVVGVSLLNKG